MGGPSQITFSQSQRWYTKLVSRSTILLYAHPRTRLNCAVKLHYLWTNYLQSPTDEAVLTHWIIRPVRTPTFSLNYLHHLYAVGLDVDTLRKIVATLLKDKKLIGFEEQSAVTIEGLLHRATTCGTSKLKKNLVII
ncbi:uncharacterized protein OCT59_001342 [Rhizophagus irregularis]|uniref:uncharacterized protein n=1 Tax=Rhizophagus irregularis TaxID=588596 RepID=UPI00331E026B|nr:hypothetical protein OCT59_001342 [Rhizophagus irregularis]